jgi:hypothetical protein
MILHKLLDQPAGFAVPHGQRQRLRHFGLL